METFDYTGYLQRGTADYQGSLYAFELPRSTIGAVAFHLAIWLSGVDTTKFRLVNDLEQVSRGTLARGAILFANESDHQAFSTWWAHYCLNFIGGEVEKEFLPCPPRDQMISGWNMSFPLLIDGATRNNHREAVTSELFNSWSWIAHNAKARVWRIPGCYVFESEDDAMLFKLTYQD